MDIMIIKVVFDLLKQMVTGRIKNRKERFEKQLEPIFDKFLIVHRDYVMLYEGVISALIDATFHPEMKEETIKAIKREFEPKRNEYEGLRTGLRAMTDKLIMSTDQNDEKRFLWAVICYFLEYEDPHKQPDKLDRQIALLEKEGYQGVFNTPASYLLKALSTENDIKELLKVVSSKRDRLSAYLSDVCNTFASLKTDVYK